MAVNTDARSCCDNLLVVGLYGSGTYLLIGIDDTGIAWKVVAGCRRS